MKTFAIANQKGGVGKTTLARNLAFFAMDAGLRTLCVDLDPQRNFSRTLLAQRAKVHGDTELPPHLSASKLFDARLPKLRPLDCGSGAALIEAERELVDVASMVGVTTMQRPRECLNRLAGDFDVCIIDTAPTLGMPLYAALVAATAVVCPCTMDQDAIDGLADLFEDIQRVRQEGWNSSLVNLGVLANRVNARRAFDRNSLAQLQDEDGVPMLKSVLYDRAATQYAKDRPVWRIQSGESQILAAREMKAVCAEILQITTTKPTARRT